MIKRKYNKLYLIDNKNNDDEITIDLEPFYLDVDLKIKSKTRRDTFVRIGTDEPQAFEIISNCFDSIMSKYDSESELDKRYTYE